jgi:hypothetical protein
MPGERWLAAFRWFPTMLTFWNPACHRHSQVGHPLHQNHQNEFRTSANIFLFSDTCFTQGSLLGNP